MTYTGSRLPRPQLTSPHYAPLRPFASNPLWEKPGPSPPGGSPPTPAQGRPRRGTETRFPLSPPLPSFAPARPRRTHRGHMRGARSAAARALSAGAGAEAAAAAARLLARLLRGPGAPSSGPGGSLPAASCPWPRPPPAAPPRKTLRTLRASRRQALCPHRSA